MVIKAKQKSRCATGIPGFDSLCQGGLYKDSVNVILGGPGAGKTTFLLQYLWNGINKYNENGLYVSFESHDEDLFLDAKTYGWDFMKLYDEGTCQFLRISPKTTVFELSKKLERLALKTDVKRVCIDPIAILSMAIKDESLIRQSVYDLATMLKRFNITTLIADETIEGTAENITLGNEETRTQSMKFLADGLINIYSSGLGGESDRAIRIVKMRRTNHVRGPVPFKITDNGIVVSPRRKVA